MRIIPKISTRGYYDLKNGKTIKNNKYYLYPKNLLEKLDSKELTIVIHGLRNDKKSANSKFLLVKNKLRKLNYHYPVIGFSYDSNTKGAHIPKYIRRSLRIGELIAKKNGKNLSKFIIDLNDKYPKTKIRLVGHSLGSQVILHTLEELLKKNKNNIISSVYFFGASVDLSILLKPNIKSVFQKTVEQKIINYFAPSDEVLDAAQKYGLIRRPIGLVGTVKASIGNLHDLKVYPKNHRFASYSETIKKFP